MRILTSAHTPTSAPSPKFINPEMNNAEYWWFRISYEGIDTLGMLLNFAVALSVAKITKKPQQRIQSWWKKSEFRGK